MLLPPAPSLLYLETSRAGRLEGEVYGPVRKCLEMLLELLGAPGEFLKLEIFRGALEFSWQFGVVSMVGLVCCDCCGR